MDFYSDLIKITEFQPFEDYLVRKKATELQKLSQSGKITVAINPSNLIELTQVGERFAPDSCVDNRHLKYVVSDKFIPNKHIETHLVKRAKEFEYSSFSETREVIDPIIPQLIVRQRPGITYNPIRETSYSGYYELPKVNEESQNIAQVTLPKQDASQRRTHTDHPKAKVSHPKSQINHPKTQIVHSKHKSKPKISEDVVPEEKSKKNKLVVMITKELPEKEESPKEEVKTVKTVLSRKSAPKERVSFADSTSSLR